MNLFRGGDKADYSVSRYTKLGNEVDRLCCCSRNAFPQSEPATEGRLLNCSIIRELSTSGMVLRASEVKIHFMRNCPSHPKPRTLQHAAFKLPLAEQLQRSPTFARTRPRLCSHPSILIGLLRSSPLLDDSDPLSLSSLPPSLPPPPGCMVDDDRPATADATVPDGTDDCATTRDRAVGIKMVNVSWMGHEPSVSRYPPTKLSCAFVESTFGTISRYFRGLEGSSSNCL